MFSEKPLVSIIIPTFNRAHLLAETLDSVLVQTYENWECIVVDDGSTDTTENIMLDYVLRDSRFQHHHRPKDTLSGGNAARNYGFKISKGSFIQWFDDDDLMVNNFIELKVNAFEKNVDFVIFGGWYFFLNGSNQKIDVFLPKNLYKDYVLWKINIFTPSVMFNRDFLNNRPLFNESILKGQESEFFSRLFFHLKNGQYKVINIPLFYYRRHCDTKSEQSKIYNTGFKFCIAMNHLANLRRGFEKKDRELIGYFYKKCLKVLNSAIQNKDQETANFVRTEIGVLITPKNRKLYLKIILFSLLKRFKMPYSAKLFQNLKYNIPNP